MLFRQMIEGKKVLLLGPASYLYDGTFSEDLSNYDVVVKLNRMIEADICKHFINDRCDVLYHCLDVAPQYGMVQYDLALLKRRIKHLRVPYPRVTGYYDRNIMKFKALNEEYGVKFSVIEKDTFLEIQNGCKSSPNTGTIAIYDILSNDPKTLTIKGITMFDGGYNKEYRTSVVTEEEVENINTRVGNHNTNKQRRFLKGLLDQYGEKVIYDEHFAKGLEKK
jgi:hypothetical protein